MSEADSPRSPAAGTPSGSDEARVAMLRSKLLQAQQHHSEREASPVGRFLADDSKREALQTLQEEVARNKDRGQSQDQEQEADWDQDVDLADGQVQDEELGRESPQPGSRNGQDRGRDAVTPRSNGRGRDGSQCDRAQSKVAAKAQSKSQTKAKAKAANGVETKPVRKPRNSLAVMEPIIKVPPPQETSRRPTIATRAKAGPRRARSDGPWEGKDGVFDEYGKEDGRTPVLGDRLFSAAVRAVAPVVQAQPGKSDTGSRRKPDEAPSVGETRNSEAAPASPETSVKPTGEDAGKPATLRSEQSPDQPEPERGEDREPVNRVLRGRGAKRYGGGTAEETLRSAAMEKGSSWVDDDKPWSHLPLQLLVRRSLSQRSRPRHVPSPSERRRSRSRRSRSRRPRSKSRRSRSKRSRSRSSHSRRTRSRRRSKSRRKSRSGKRSRSRRSRSRRSRSRRGKSRSRSKRRSRSRRGTRRRSRSRKDKKDRRSDKDKNDKKGKSDKARSRDRDGGKKSRHRSRSGDKKRDDRKSRKDSSSRSRRRSRSRSRSRRRRSRSRSRDRRKKSRSRTSSRSRRRNDKAPSASDTKGVTDDVQKQLEKFKPYSRVLLCDLLKNVELNGQCGVVLPPGCSQFPDVPGCLKVRMETGREVAVKPANLQMLMAANPIAPVPEPANQEQRLQQVLAQIKTEARGDPPAGTEVPQAGIPGGCALVAES